MLTGQRKPPSIFTQIWDLFLIELTSWRWCWRSLLITATVTPLMSILALGIFARDLGYETLSYILTGNLVLSLMFGNMDNLQGHFSYIRFMGTQDYFATLPVWKISVILAVVSAFFLLSIPSLIITLLLGAYFLDISLTIHPLVTIVIPLCTLPLSAIGALIGIQSRTPQESGALTLLLTMTMTALGPVVIPPERLPKLIITLGHMSPATYAASALRQVLLGPVTDLIIMDIAVLGIMAGIIFWFVGRKMDWRQS